MKKMLSLIAICGGLLLTVGCSSDSDYWVRYPHEYEGVVEINQYTSGYSVSRHYYSGRVRTYYEVDCTPKENTSAFNRIIFDQYDGDEEFKAFLMQNVGKKVRIKVEVITREGNDHETSYGSYEIIDYEVID